jgi:hypothetical protein
MVGMNWVGKKVKVIFYDGEKINSKTGILKNLTDEFVYLELYDSEEAIALDKIIRMELVK